MVGRSNSSPAAWQSVWPGRTGALAASTRSGRSPAGTGPAAAGHRQQRADAHRAGRLAEDRDVAGVAAEGGDVVPDPLEGGDLVEQAEVGGRRRRSSRNRRRRGGS